MSPARGDAAAALRIPHRPGADLAVSVDTLVAGVHFPQDASAADVGHKALAVNLSDLAAMGADAEAALVCLSTPPGATAWARDFEAGLRALAADHAVALAPLARREGALAVTVHVYGAVPPGAALTRRGARPGDGIYVTGTLGDAGLALAARSGTLDVAPQHRALVDDRLARPRPRLAAGRALRGIASAAIDLSDGLAGDLGHVLAASGAGATVHVGALPLSGALRALSDPAQAWHLALGAGDDYELCACVAPACEPALAAVRAALGCALTRIGTVEASPGLRLLDPDGRTLDPVAAFRHFG